MSVTCLNVLSSNLKIYGKLTASLSKVNTEKCAFLLFMVL